jgi:voltage-gated potassium channel
MIRLLLVSLGLTALTVLIHGMGTFQSVLWIARLREKKLHPHKPLGTELLIIRLVCVLLLLHITEICVWAGYYRIGNLLPDFETAAYFSLTSYTTVGYGDVVLTEGWRLLGPIEAVVGVLMMGWSTGIMVAIITRLFVMRFPSFTMKNVHPHEEPNREEKGP